MKRQIQKFEVGLKAFIVQEDRLLMVKERDTGLWEIPGGRIDVGEELIPQLEVLVRELKEELGSSINIVIENPLITWIRKREDGFVFLVGILCTYINGDIELSSEHSSFEWVDCNNWKKLNLADGYHAALEQFWQKQAG